MCGPLPCRVLWELLAAVPADVRSQVVSLAIDGTSATAMLLDEASGAVLQPPKLYNEAQSKEAVQAAKVRSGVHSYCNCIVELFRHIRMDTYRLL